MTFLNPLLLFGLAAAALPLVIHLLTRRRPRRTTFSSIVFLREVRLAEMRRFRLREWLLLLLRILAVACLALALARPALQGSILSSKGTTTSYILIDRSLSMAQREGGETFFERAKNRSLAVLGALESGDRVQVLAFDGTVEVLFPDIIENHGRARAAIEGLEVGGGGSDIEAALSAAIEALGNSPSLNRELYVFTDLQRSGLEGEVPERDIPSGLRVYFVTLSDVPAPTNRTISAVRYKPGDPPSIDVDVRSFGGENDAAARGNEITVTAQALVEIGRWREAGRGFIRSGDEGGGGLIILQEKIPLGGRVELAADALPDDDRRAFVGGQAGAVRVGLVSTGRSLAIALETGVETGRFVLTRIEASQLVVGALAGLDVIVLDDLKRLSDGALQTVVDFARQGGGVALVLGPNTDPVFLNNRLFPALGDLRIEGEEPRRAQGGGWALRRAAVGHPAFAGMSPGVDEALSQAEFFSAWKVEPGNEGRVLARFAADLPAVVERERILILTSDVGGEWSDFLLSGTFLPFWHQALIHIAHGSTPELIVGERLNVPAPVGEAQAVWSMKSPSGSEIPIEVRLAGGAPRLLSPPLQELGLHLLIASGRVVRTVSVTSSLIESDLTRLTAGEASERWSAISAQIVPVDAPAEKLVREGRYGRELWREFLLLALLFLVSEMLLARLWGARKKSMEDLETAPPAEPRRAAGA